jgi:hypothetical protein
MSKTQIIIKVILITVVYGLAGGSAQRIWRY